MVNTDITRKGKIMKYQNSRTFLKQEKPDANILEPQLANCWPNHSFVRLDIIFMQQGSNRKFREVLFDTHCVR